MPLLRPLTRTFPVALNSSSRAPLIASITALPKAALQQQIPAATQQTSGFSSSAAMKSGDSPHYDPPGGWLWGVPPGEEKKREPWERVWIWGFWGSLGVTVVAYAYKPDTSIQTWALEEARRRLEAEGILPDPSSGKSE